MQVSITGLAELTWLLVAVNKLIYWMIQHSRSMADIWPVNVISGWSTSCCKQPSKMCMELEIWTNDIIAAARHVQCTWLARALGFQWYHLHFASLQSEYYELVKGLAVISSNWRLRGVTVKCPSPLVTPVMLSRPQDHWKPVSCISCIVSRAAVNIINTPAVNATIYCCYQ